MVAEANLAFGRHAATSALNEGVLQRLIVAAGTNQDICKAANKAGIDVELADRRKLDRLAGNSKHQGIVALCKETVSGHWRPLADARSDPLLLVLDRVEDPRNLGACVRTAAAMDVAAVVVPRRHSSSMTPAARKVASGGAETVPVVTVTNLARELRAMRTAGIMVVGADQNARTDIWQLDGKGPLALVLGGEEKGLRRLTRENCDMLVSIPMPGERKMESLNVSVACGIMLAAISRGRGKTGRRHSRT